MKALASFLLLQELIGLPGSIVAAEKQLSERERVVQGIPSRSQGAPTVRVFDCDHPPCPLGADCPPARLAGLPVVVPGDSTMRDKGGKLGKDVGLNRGDVRRRPLRSLLSFLNPFHGKLRRGHDQKPVELATPRRVD